MRRFVVSAFALSCLILVAACGDPAGPQDPFTFDPVPYVTIPSGTPVSVDPMTCDVFVANEVIVYVEPDRLSPFKEWLAAMEFTVLDEGIHFDNDPVLVLVGVPVGSVPDAVRFLARVHGVTSSSDNGFGRIPEGSETPLIPCTPVPS